MTKLIAFFGASLLMLGCASSFQYTGKSYPATSQVDIFFSTKDVKKSFEVMGTINGTIGQSTDFNQTMEKVKKEARKQGADAIIIEGIELVQNSPDSTATEKGGMLVNQTLVSSHSKINYGYPSNRQYDELKGQLIKYK
jgi:hypothetical protein